MFFIDIAVPRDVDPTVHQLDNVYVYDIDDLKAVVSENMALRQEEAERAAGIIQAEAAEFGAWLEALDLAPTIAELVRRGEPFAVLKASTLRAQQEEQEKEEPNRVRLTVGARTVSAELRDGILPPRFFALFKGGDPAELGALKRRIAADALAADPADLFVLS